MIKPLMPSFIEKICLEHFSRDLTSHYDKISKIYREKGSPKSSLRFKEDQIKAYACARLPATLTVADAVIKRLLERCPFQPTSFLDLGSGLGSFLWAMIHHFPHLQKCVLWEGNPYFLELLKSFILHQDAESPSLKNVLFLGENLSHDRAWSLLTDTFNLVSISYVLSELEFADQTKLLENAWNRTSSILIITEPGTPEGFSNILKARNFLIKQGGVILGPCTHQNQCPLTYKPKDWCHFSVRLLRSEGHKTLKNAKLPFEDEKYSYLIVAKDIPDLNPNESRILKNPLKRSGHISLDLCSPSGEKRLTVSKKRGGIYKNAQKKRWGDLWSNPEGD